MQTLALRGNRRFRSSLFKTLHRDAPDENIKLRLRWVEDGLHCLGNEPSRAPLMPNHSAARASVISCND
jgi:hypothetical protein